MSRFVVLKFEVDESFTPGEHSTDEELLQQIDDLITQLDHAPGAWVFHAGEVTHD